MFMFLRLLKYVCMLRQMQRGVFAPAHYGGVAATFSSVFCEWQYVMCRAKETGTPFSSFVWRDQPSFTVGLSFIEVVSWHSGFPFTEVVR